MACEDFPGAVCRAQDRKTPEREGKALICLVSLPNIPPAASFAKEGFGLELSKASRAGGSQKDYPLSSIFQQNTESECFEVSVNTVFSSTQGTQPVSRQAVFCQFLYSKQQVGTRLRTPLKTESFSQKSVVLVKRKNGFTHHAQKDYRTELYYFRIIFGNSCSVITEPICFWN